MTLFAAPIDARYSVLRPSRPPVHASWGVTYAHRHARDLRRHARSRQGRRVRLPGDQLHLVRDDQRRAAGVRRRRQRRHHPVLDRRGRVRLGHQGEGHGHRRGRAGRVRARRRGQVPDQRRAAHRPLPEGQARRLRPSAARDLAGAGRPRARTPLFQSHMWDGSAVPLAENLEIAQELLAKAAAAHIVLELEIGVVGGEEDGVVGEINDKLYTTPEDALATAEALGTGENGRYLLAATFGNVHGVYKPGNVKLRPSVLKDIQDAVGAKVGQDRAVRPGVPRRLGLGRGRHPRGALVRRGEDERRHRHPVRVHPADRRAHVQQLRRRAQDRRRGRRQEGLRPAHLPEAGRAGDGGARRRRPAPTCSAPAPTRPERTFGVADRRMRGQHAKSCRDR